MMHFNMAMSRRSDVRLVELTSKTPVHQVRPLQVRFDCDCPYCDTKGSLWVHFAGEKGQFVCRPCGATGAASYQLEGDGKRIVTLDLRGDSDDEAWD